MFHAWKTIKFSSKSLSVKWVSHCKRISISVEHNRNQTRMAFPSDESFFVIQSSKPNEMKLTWNFFHQTLFTFAWERLEKRFLIRDKKAEFLTCSVSFEDNLNSWNRLRDSEVESQPFLTQILKAKAQDLPYWISSILNHFHVILRVIPNDN